MFRFHDRLQESLTEENCKGEMDSIAKHGQLVPALGRVLTGDTQHAVELIYGSRRLFVAQLLNVPLNVEIRELSDRDAIVAMDIENRHRKDISHYERGLSYQRWLVAKQFDSQEEIAHALKISAAQVSRLLKLARLPAVLTGAFGTPAEICEGWGSELMDAWDDPGRRQLLGQRARSIAAETPKPSAREVFRRLLVSPSSRKRLRERDEIVTGGDGRPLFRVRPQQKTVALLLPRSSVTPQSLELLKTAVAGVLESDIKHTHGRVSVTASGRTDRTPLSRPALQPTSA